MPLPSAIHDFESFLWILVYVLLCHNPSTRDGADKLTWDRLLPGVRRSISHSDSKTALLVELAYTKIRPGSVLFPYSGLIKGLASLIFGYYRGEAEFQSEEELEFETHSETVKLSAIDKYITTFENFLDKGK